jgi:hypothetical protein
MVSLLLGMATTEALQALLRAWEPRQEWEVRYALRIPPSCLPELLYSDRKFANALCVGAPGMAPPGIGAPGTVHGNATLPPRPGGLHSNFQPPVNMPNINFSAPVIRLGTTGPSKDSPMSAGGRVGNSEQLGGGRRGLGMDRGGMDHSRPQRIEQMSLIPPTREEIMRTIFVGKISPAITDNDLERILRAAGSLRRWTRAYDVDNKPCTFGFAEYEDAESLETAAEVLPEVEVPAKKPEKPEVKSEIKVEENGEENRGTKGVEKVKLLVRMPLNVWIYKANMSARSKLTKRQGNMLKNGERSEERMNPHSSSELILQKKHWAKFLPACLNLLLSCRQTEMSRWKT